jgi:hypothetical protein
MLRPVLAGNDRFPGVGLDSTGNENFALYRLQKESIVGILQARENAP